MAPSDEVTPAEATPLGRGERGKARRRLRYLRKLRELQLRDAGGLVFDLYRFGEQREGVVRAKLDAIIATDKEIAGLEELLGERRRELDVRQPGVGGTCPSCGAFHASDARYCATCGIELAAMTEPGTVSGNGAGDDAATARIPPVGAPEEPESSPGR